MTNLNRVFYLSLVRDPSYQPNILVRSFISLLQQLMYFVALQRCHIAATSSSELTTHSGILAVQPPRTNYLLISLPVQQMGNQRPSSLLEAEHLR